MPYIALHNDRKIAPKQAPTDESVTCPECGGNMRVRGPYSDGRARHFWHIDNLGGGKGGPGNPCETVAESDKHKKWKSLAADRLLHYFGDNCRTCRMEMQLDAPESEKDHRIADALLLFDERDPQLGQGIVVEVQHKNESKDIDATTTDYLANDIAVVWTDGSDFGDNRMLLNEKNIRQRARNTAWPQNVPTVADWDPSPTGRELLNDLAGKIAIRHIDDDIVSVPATIPAKHFADVELDWLRGSLADLDAPAANQYIDEVANTGVAGPVPLDTANLSGVLPKAFWEKYRHRILSEVSTHRPVVAEGLKSVSYNRVVPVTLPNEALSWLGVRASGNIYPEDSKVVQKCIHCGSKQTRWFSGEENQISVICSECDRWCIVLATCGCCERQFTFGDLYALDLDWSQVQRRLATSQQTQIDTRFRCYRCMQDSGQAESIPHQTGVTQ